MQVAGTWTRSPCRPCRPCRRRACRRRRRRHPSWGLRRWPLGRDHQAGHRGGVLKSRADHLRRIDDASRDQVDIFFRLGVEAEGRGAVLEDLAHDDRAFHAGVLGDLTDRRLQGPTDDGDARVLVGVVALEAFAEGRNRARPYQAVERRIGTPPVIAGTAQRRPSAPASYGPQAIGSRAAEPVAEPQTPIAPRPPQPARWRSRDSAPRR